MKLWDDELEALRPAIEAETATFVAASNYGTNEDDPTTIDLDARRAFMNSMSAPSDLAVDRTIKGPGGEIRLHTFTPPGAVKGVLLHIHGGGWIMGRPEMNDLANETLAKEHDIAVVSVDYRLAPEHPFPAGPDDCEAAALWLLEHAVAEFGSDNLLIGGESAGGHLTALTLLRMRDRHGAADRFLGANIVFGVHDLSHPPSQRGVNGSPDILSVSGVKWFTELFTPGLSPEERRNPEYSPLYADLTGMPPALFTVGTADHLADDTIFLASRWVRAGNETELLVYPGAPHGCIGLPSVAPHYTARVHAFFHRCLADG